jgi:UDP-galactopyranose mutase
MVNMIVGVDMKDYMVSVDALEYHGTTAVFCEIDSNPYSWIYQPSSKHESHRIICTGNFAKSNNSSSLPIGRITATIEFTDEVSKDSILDNLKRIPFNPTYITHKYNQYTYPIQDANTRSMIQKLKAQLAPLGFYFTGRFADWEYYNMDVSIGAAMNVCKSI